MQKVGCCDAERVCAELIGRLWWIDPEKIWKDGWRKDACVIGEFARIDSAKGRGCQGSQVPMSGIVS